MVTATISIRQWSRRGGAGLYYMMGANHKYSGYYYFDKDGKMVKRWFCRNGNTYYFDATGYQPNFVFVFRIKHRIGITWVTRQLNSFSAPFGFQTEF